MELKDKELKDREENIKREINLFYKLMSKATCI